MLGRGLLLAVSALVLAACGSTTTKTVTRVTPGPSTTQVTTTATPVTTGATTPVTSGTTSTATTASPVFFEGVGGGSRQRPGSLQLTGDGTLLVTGVQWSSWGGTTATGSGNAEYHGCSPNCAEAPLHTALVSIHLSGVRVCSGRHYYSGVELRLNSGQLLNKQFLQRSWSPC